MILACPFCQTRYLISAHIFIAGPRQVRCVRCSHSWQADLPKEIDVVGVPEAISTPQEIPPIPSGSGLPALRKERMSARTRHIIMGVSGAVLFVLLAGLVLGRQIIAETWPKTEGYFQAIGLHIYHYGEELSFEKVRSELRFDSGIMRLGVEGAIRNGSGKIQEIPAILATAMGADGKPIQSWQIDLPAPRVAPGEAMPFRSEITAPRITVTEIDLKFIEKKKE